jgi:Zn-dependent peptidase ImmA (M78 family)
VHNTIKFTDISSVAAKLKEARTACGLSTQAAAALIIKRCPGISVSHATIANYEKCAGVPGIDMISAFAAVYERPLNWFLEPGLPMTGVRYRLLSSKTSIKERNQYESQARYWLESYIRLEERLGRPLKGNKRPAITPSMTAMEAALAVRDSFDLKAVDPVPSVIEMLEKCGVRTMELPTTLAIDGFAARLGSEPVVILNPAGANDRCRLNAGHELGHVLFGDCDSGKDTTKEMDDRAFEFASHLLILPEQLSAAFSGRSAVRLVQYKERYGISMAAMIYRAEKLGIIDAKTTRWLWMQFSRRGWRAKEPGTVRSDRAVRFERLLDQAIAEKTLTWSEAADVTGIEAGRLRRRRDRAMGITEEEVTADVLKIKF